MSFKVKNRKKMIVDTRITIDAKHNNKIHYFKELNESLPLKKKNLNILKKKLNIINQRILKELTNDEFNLKIKMEDEIELLKETILDIESNKEEKEYYKKTGSILFDYYDNSNKYDKKITNSINKKRNSKSVMDWFNKNNKIKSNTKKEVCDKYLSLTDPNFVRKINEMPPDFCKNCNIERKTHLSDGCLVCQKCGEVEYIVIDSDKPSYKDPPKEISYFAYKRINHFNEWLAQFQAKETTEIPQELYELILKEIKKERIQDTRELSLLKVREILKKLKKNKYYEHVPHIINKLNGLPPPIMSRETEEELRRMFKEIQIPFAKFCPKERKNFLSYSYVLHKFVQLLELDHFLDCFILLKSREKLHQQDLIWKNICKYLKWEYIPSV
tara:strand:- start:6566 stop:7723 length:1158 start_codon:yes stop_codon:yes gene_type:complete